MTFSVNAVNPGGAEPVPGTFPSFMQFLLAGVALGGSDVDTVDVQTGLTASRGTGPTANVLTLKSAQPIGVTIVTTSTYTVLPTDGTIIVNFAGTCTLTLLASATVPGQRLNIKTVQPNAVVSASANVTARTDLTAATPILPATDGAWAVLVATATVWHNIAGS